MAVGLTVIYKVEGADFSSAPFLMQYVTLSVGILRSLRSLTRTCAYHPCRPPRQEQRAGGWHACARAQVQAGGAGRMTENIYFPFLLNISFNVNPRRVMPSRMTSGWQ